MRQTMRYDEIDGFMNEYKRIHPLATYTIVQQNEDDICVIDIYDNEENQILG